jgi:hypothetical protein
VLFEARLRKLFAQPRAVPLHVLIDGVEDDHVLLLRVAQVLPQEVDQLLDQSFLLLLCDHF